MKIVHLADSHLGFSAYGRVDRWGRNLREEMVYQGFKKAIDKIIELRPDAVVHAGDVFHHVRPRIRPLYVFKQNLERLIEEEIPVIIISGNHDAPKSYAALSPFTLYEGMKNVHIAHHYEYECFEVDDYKFHCIPFCLSPEDYLEEFRKIKYSGKDVLVMHGLVEAFWDKRLRTVGEHELKDSFLKSDFSYIALGHYHGQARLTQNAWYSGSIEYFRFNEAHDKKGMLLVDLESGEVEPIPVRKKYMFDFDPVDCSDFTSENITKELRNLCDEIDIKNKIIRIKLKNVSREAYRNVNQVEISRLKGRAIHLEILPDFKNDALDLGVGPMDVDQLPQEFKKFLKEEASRKKIPRAIANEVIDYGADLIERTAERNPGDIRCA
ncbi:MAG: metallophosphoesterase family protein [Methanotrichaceae archaeon]